MKVLRPLRMISRNQGLRISIEALGVALGSILNVIIVSLLFYCMFGIIGVNYFKGKYYDCTLSKDQHAYYEYSLAQYGLDTASVSTDESEMLFSKYNCMNVGGLWKRDFLNFDNIS